MLGLDLLEWLLFCTGYDILLFGFCVEIKMSVSG